MNNETTAGDLRAARMSDVGATEEPEKKSRLQSLREVKRLAMGAKERAKKIEEKITAPAKAATGKVLQWLWKVTFTLIGFIPGLLGLNIYVFLSKVFGDKFFCKLGEEWIPKQVQAAGGESVKTANKAAGFVEVMVLIFLNFAVILLIILAFSVLFIILEMVFGIFDWGVEWFEGVYFWK